MKNVFALLSLSLFTASLFGQKKVLIEQFSNASCISCATYTPLVHNFGTQNKAVVISYHTPFPNQHDSMHFENVQDATARINYYTVSTAPYTVMDGGFYKDISSIAVDSLQQKLGENFNQSPALQSHVLIKNFRIENNEAKARLIFIGLEGFVNLDMRGHIVLVEKVVPKSAYLATPGSNAEQEYMNVMRQMYMAQAGGHKLQFTQLNLLDTVDVSFPLTNVKSQKQLRLVGFMQNNDTKKVPTANFEDLVANPPTSVKRIDNTIAKWAYNPIAKNYIVNFETEQVGVIKIFTIAGQLVKKINVTNETQKTVVVNELFSGVYIATFSNDKATTATKLIVE